VKPLPGRGGSYALYLYLNKTRRIRIGKLGGSNFQKGDYVYVGSAFGPGGLAARIGRHLRRQKRLHWHIDKLLEHAQVRGIIYTTAPDSVEHEWSQRLSRMPSATVPMKGFGASDCRERCGSHLIRLDSGISVARMQRHLARWTKTNIRSITLD
jgi:Uri superfamily endonuclease